MKWKYHLKYAGSAIAHLFYPCFCELCGTELKRDEEVLCLHCRVSLPRTGFHQIADNPAFQNFIGRVPVAKATAFVYFTKQGMMQHLLHRFKYKGRPEIGKYMGKLFAGELKALNWANDIDGIVAVPLHRKKQYERGYNQSGAFAEGLSEELGIPLLSGVLIRTRNTESQTHKSRAERIENVKDVFQLRKNISNRHLLLVDDVLTTGATLEACTKTLLQANEVKVSIAALALAKD